MVRTRFAPSPTGHLHIGSARTALYCWLFARKMQGRFILRIEDTDRERSTPESVQAILGAMEWLGLDYDEGPFYQTHRFDRYAEVIAQMLASGTAYRCTCSKERLEKLRAEQMARKEKPRYDGTCRNVQPDHNKPSVVRFKNPTDGEVEFNDLVRGSLRFANAELDDLIIARSDGTPTYNFTVVVDDMDMQITHVLRGDDHINNTPRQINILRALGAAPPLYGHLPTILGKDGKRLSKRHGAVSVMQYREEGYVPDALLNYLARLGWSYGDQEIFSREELVLYFDISGINRAPAAFDPEKLRWLNQQYLKQGPTPHLVSEFAWHLAQLHIDTTKGPVLDEVFRAQSGRTKTLREMAERSRFFFEDFPFDEALKPHFSADLMPAIQTLREQFAGLKSWTKETIHEIIKNTANQFGLNLGQLAQPLRIAMTGGTVSPPIDETVHLIGQERAVARLSQVLSS